MSRARKWLLHYSNGFTGQGDLFDVQDNYTINSITVLFILMFRSLIYVLPTNQLSEACPVLVYVTD